MPRKLHIGGIEKREGWEILNAIQSPDVDHFGNANDLSQFEDNSFAEIYASHIVEHLDYKDEIQNTLKEWFRVLEPKGKLLISVPDMDILCQLFLLKDEINTEDKFRLMRMMFGGHLDKYDYHYVGLNGEFLHSYLHYAGFTNIKKVKEFDLFSDDSKSTFKGIPISLNVVAEKA